MQYCICGVYMCLIGKRDRIKQLATVKLWIKNRKLLSINYPRLRQPKKPDRGQEEEE